MVPPGLCDLILLTVSLLRKRVQCWSLFSHRAVMRIDRMCVKLYGDASTFLFLLVIWEVMVRGHPETKEIVWILVQMDTRF